MAKVGYARVSSNDQDHSGQIDRLKTAGCRKVYCEKVSGKSTNGRHELGKALKALRHGDVLVVTRLDRLARSIRDLLTLVDAIKAAGAAIKALDDTWLDTSTAQGELILTVMGGLAEFERKLTRQRCEEGIKRAKALGKHLGRKPDLDPGQRRKIAERYAAGESLAVIGRDYDVSASTVWRAVRPDAPASAAPIARTIPVAERAALREDYMYGRVSTRKLASRYGISADQVRRDLRLGDADTHIAAPPVRRSPVHLPRPLSPPAWAGA